MMTVYIKSNNTSSEIHSNDNIFLIMKTILTVITDKASELIAERE